VTISGVLFIFWLVIVIWWFIGVFGAQNRKRDRDRK